MREALVRVNYPNIEEFTLDNVLFHQPLPLPIPGTLTVSFHLGLFVGQNNVERFAQLTAVFGMHLIDIGIVRSGEILLYNASLRNTGEEPMVIKNVNTSCGCTSVEYEKQPIAPGQEGNLSLRFDSKGMAGMQIKLIEISTSAGTYPYQVLLRIEVTGNENF